GTDRPQLGGRGVDVRLTETPLQRPRDRWRGVELEGDGQGPGHAPPRGGAASAASTATTGAAPTVKHTATMNTWRNAHTAASVRSRRVHASGAVRPRRVSPSGPVATVAEVTIPAAGVTAIPASPATAATRRILLAG